MYCNHIQFKWLTSGFIYFFKMSDIVYDFVFVMALAQTHRGSREVQYRWGVEEGCASTLVTGPSGLLHGCMFTWTLPPQRASTSQTRLASLAGPAVTLQPDPMIHSVGQISHYPAHSECTVHVTALYQTVRQKDVSLVNLLAYCFSIMCCFMSHCGVCS